MMLADLPPSSSSTGFRDLPAADMMILPVSDPPVKPTISTSGCVTSAVPVTGPRPLTRLTTPGGSPASWKISTMRCMECGVYSEGLSTQVLPKAMQVATRIEASGTGAFHGAIIAPTPTGSRVT